MPLATRGEIPLHSNYLGSNSANPDRVEDGIGEEAFKHISLTMNFPGIDFIEHSHHDKCIENYCEMLSGFPFDILSTFNVQKLITCNM